MFPEEVGDAAVERADSRRGVDLTAQTWVAIPARKSGYIQGIDTDALFKIAREQRMVVRMERGIGEFAIEDSPLASVAGKQPDDEAIRKLNAAYTVGRQRTVHQDVAYGIRQIVDVALKALSPGINDTTTAINCVDYLGAILARLAPRPIETPYRADGGQVRIITRGPTFPGLLAEAFDQIRQNAAGNVAVFARLLEVVEILAGRTADHHRQQTLREQAGLIVETAERSIPSAHDRATIHAAPPGPDARIPDERREHRRETGREGPLGDGWVRDCVRTRSELRMAACDAQRPRALCRASSNVAPRQVLRARRLARGR